MDQGGPVTGDTPRCRGKQVVSMEIKLRGWSQEAAAGGATGRRRRLRVAQRICATGAAQRILRVAQRICATGAAPAATMVEEGRRDLEDGDDHEKHRVGGQAAAKGLVEVLLH